MKILFVAAEAAPLVKVGGLADVVGSLPQALVRLGHDVRVMIPRYGALDFARCSITPAIESFEVPVMGRPEPASLSLATVKDRVPVYLVENDKYFGGREVYGKNDLEKFLFFSRAAFEVLPQLDWQPDVVHCHDWHTGLLVMWLKRAGCPYATVFTIHNLAYQGAFDEYFLRRAGLEQYWADCLPNMPKPPLNFLSQGILSADLVTTVSETYAREIVTPECGMGLDTLLNCRRKDLLGIVNGIDYDEYNPQTDPYIEAHFDAKTIERRAINKTALKKCANLPGDTTIPLVGMVHRLDEQKGFDIFEEAFDCLLQENRAQFVVLGRGWERYEDMLRKKAACYPEQMAFFLGFNEPVAHLIYAGSDIFLMPSRFEPCGLGQLIAMRYGALPIVRHTGGLVDTVEKFAPDLANGNGFVFHEYSAEALRNAVKEGVSAFNNANAWQRAVRRVMKLDFSWLASARKYEATYQRALRARKEET